MSYQEPPVFVDGEILSASALNTLGTNQNYLNDRIVPINPAFAEVEIDNVTTDIYYEWPHLYNYLRVRATLTGGSDLHIYYDNTKIGEITSSGAADEIFDLTSFAFVKGERYRIRFAWAGGGSVIDEILIRYAAERPDGA